MSRRSGHFYKFNKSCVVTHSGKMEAVGRCGKSGCRLRLNSS
jgi:hypothetical protein